MDFREAVRELSRLQGQTVLFHVRLVGDEAILFQLLDRIDRVWSDDDAAHAVFLDVESSLVVRRAAFAGAAWEGGWRKGEEDEPLLRIRLGSVEVGFLPT